MPRKTSKEKKQEAEYPRFLSFDIFRIILGIGFDRTKCFYVFSKQRLYVFINKRKSNLKIEYLIQQNLIPHYFDEFKNVKFKKNKLTQTKFNTLRRIILINFLSSLKMPKISRKYFIFS